MNKLAHLKKSKQFLRKVVKYRRDLLKNNYGKQATESMVKSMAAIPFHISRIVSFDQMMRYLGRQDVQGNIKELIPSNKKQWHEELDYLVTSGEILQGRRVVQREFSF